jgi:hypothetical protein
MESELDILKETIEIRIKELNELIEEFKIKAKKQKRKTYNKNYYTKIKK